MYQFFKYQCISIEAPTLANPRPSNKNIITNYNKLRKWCRNNDYGQMGSMKAYPSSKALQ